MRYFVVLLTSALAPEYDRPVGTVGPAGCTQQPGPAGSAAAVAGERTLQ